MQVQVLFLAPDQQIRKVLLIFSLRFSFIDTASLPLYNIFNKNFLLSIIGGRSDREFSFAAVGL